MQKLTMGEFKSIPQGIYQAKFLGTKPNDHPEYGPGLEWRFEVQGGSQHGMLTSRATGNNPTAKNACGRMLNGITGGVAKDQEVDIDLYIGRMYQIMVEERPTGEGTRVGSVMPAGSQMPPPALPQNSPKPPAPLPPGAIAPTPQIMKYWIVDGGKTDLVTGDSIQRAINDEKLTEAALIMDEKQSGGWKAAKEYGFTKGVIPF